VAQLSARSILWNESMELSTDKERIRIVFGGMVFGDDMQ